MTNNEYEYLIDEIDAELIPNLARFVRIPNQSRSFDPQWETNGLILKTCTFLMNWAAKQGLTDYQIELLHEEGLTPTILIQVDPPQKSEKTILMYGHVDKQPPLTEEWRDGKQPYEPVYEDQKLYGRGAGDGGFTFFSFILLIKTLQKFGLQKNRFVLLFESDEQSGSRDLPYFMQKKQKEIGKPDIVLCLDGGGPDDDHFPIINSLRGVIDLLIRVDVMKNSIHSGECSGIVPDSFRILRHFLQGLENSNDGSILIDEFNPNIPGNHYEDAVETVKFFGDKPPWKFPLLPDVKKMANNTLDLYLNNTWRPQITMIGTDGIPEIGKAGNVVRAYTTFELSIRLPPNLPATDAEKLLKEYIKKRTILYNAHINLSVRAKGDGFVAKKMADELATRLNKGCEAFFGSPPLKIAEGSSIPVMGTLNGMFSAAEFIITGIMGPNSGIHGPNEYADIRVLKKNLSCLLYLLK